MTKDTIQSALEKKIEIHNTDVCVKTGTSTLLSSVLPSSLFFLNVVVHFNFLILFTSL